MFPFLCDTLFFDLGVPSCFWKFFYIAWHRATGHPFFFYSVVLYQKCVTKGKSPLSCSLIEDSCTRLYSTCTNAAKAHTNPTKWLWSDEGTKIKCISHQAVMLLNGSSPNISLQKNFALYSHAARGSLLTPRQHGLIPNLTHLQENKSMPAPSSVLFIYLDHLSHVALGPSVFGGIFNFYQHDEEQVVPHVVLFFDVLLKSHCLVVKLVPLQACRGAITHTVYAAKLQYVTASTYSTGKKVRRRWESS